MRENRYLGRVREGRKCLQYFSCDSSAIVKRKLFSVAAGKLRRKTRWWFKSAAFSVRFSVFVAVNKNSWDGVKGHWCERVTTSVESWYLFFLQPKRKEWPYQKILLRRPYTMINRLDRRKVRQILDSTLRQHRLMASKLQRTSLILRCYRFLIHIWGQCHPCLTSLPHRRSTRSIWSWLRNTSRWE